MDKPTKSWAKNVNIQLTEEDVQRVNNLKNNILCH